MSGFLSNILPFGRRRYPRIFVSYRRHGEGAGYGGRLADKLVEHFGANQCFRDVEDIESGVDFVQTITDAVGTCEVLIAVIGPDWTTQTGEKGKPRLEDPQDFVRIEVAAALERNIRVIPVLVGGAPMPKAKELPEVLEGMSRRQAHELSDTRWVYDVGELLKAIESIGILPTKKKSHRWNWKVATGILVVVLGIASMLIVDWSSLLQERWKNNQISEESSVTPTEKERQAFEQELERERRARKDAERMAKIEREESGRDFTFQKAIIGTWRSRLVTPEGAVITSQTSYAPGGRSSMTGTIMFQGQSLPVVASGTWYIMDGYIHGTIDSSNVPMLLPIGFTSSSEIIDITDREFRYISSFDGSTVIEYRAR